jgi:hypothetical protein
MGRDYRIGGHNLDGVAMADDRLEIPGPLRIDLDPIAQALDNRKKRVFTLIVSDAPDLIFQLHPIDRERRSRDQKSESLGFQLRDVAFLRIGAKEAPLDIQVHGASLVDAGHLT